MTEKTLKQYLESHSQKEIAVLLGVTPGAVSQMVASNRDIRFLLNKDGTTQVYEVKPLGSRVA